MTKRILLLQPFSRDPSPLDQSLAARVAAERVLSGQVVLEQAAFPRGDLDALEKAVERWSGKIVAVVGATSVPESTALGDSCERHGLLCFVSNNNPAVRKDRKNVFHIGVPTSATTRAVADYLLRPLRARRVYLLHDSTPFQEKVAETTATALDHGGAKVRSGSGDLNHWIEDLRSWNPDATYLIYSDALVALSLARRLSESFPATPLLLGRSLLRENFLKSLGSPASRVLLLDLFVRGAPRTNDEARFMNVLLEEGINIPTSNHGFGWDAMMLCARSLAQADGDPAAAIEYLESGVFLEGATGYFRFSEADHNGRADFNPTTLGRLRDGRIETTN